MKQRLITAVVGISVGILVLCLHNTLVFPIFVSLIAIMSVQEILTVCGCKKFPVHFGMCLLFAAAIPMLTWFPQIGIVWRMFAASLIVFFMFAGYVADHKKLPFDKLAVMVTVTSLITFSITCLVSLKNMSDIHGICYVIMALMAAWIPDAGAYFVGTACGKHKLCPDISPKKTVEGAVGGFIVTALVFVLFGMGYKYFMHTYKGIDFDVNYIALAAVMLIAAVISMVGDLSASLLKREYNIKDYGKLLPGHGGVVDRFDSVFFVLPYIMLVFNAFGQKIFIHSVS
ncbi:MAG: phosphatidate cytidylyltransferase [Huintestinicola sp.]|uniref:phosphatidate cytidylyltransferase n=1 Tax=Huintestinicola sp. TaxID=2981661 RepID=UPI003F0D5B76